MAATCEHFRKKERNKENNDYLIKHETCLFNQENEKFNSVLFCLVNLSYYKDLVEFKIMSFM